MNPEAREVVVLPDAAAVARRGAEELARAAAETLRERDVFAIALAGGSTPERLFRLLGTPSAGGFRERLPWARMHFFFGDERLVPPGHAESNYRMARAAFLESVEQAGLLPSGNVHRIRGESRDAAQAAAEYEEELRIFFRPSGAEPPRFDLVLLGMGADGHTASLFPGTAALAETRRWVAANWVAKLGTHRITLTPPVLENAARVLFLVTGEEKAATLAEVLEGNVDSERLPAQRIARSSGTCQWLVDADAARDLARPRQAQGKR